MQRVELHYLSSIEVQVRFLPGAEEQGLQSTVSSQVPQETAERSIFLLGTAHVSDQSAKQTEERIASLQPDCICIELDQKRYQTLQQKERWQDLNLFQTLKEGKGFLLLVNLLLASFQKRVGRELKMKPGQEMIRALELANEKRVHLELVDRPIEVTLKRAWAACNIWQRAKLFHILLASLLGEEEISAEDIENLKEADTLEHLMEEFANYLPSIKGSLIDERDVFLARSIAAAPGKNVFAVLGAGHLRGVCRVLERVLTESGASVTSHYTAATENLKAEQPKEESQSVATDSPKDYPTEEKETQAQESKNLPQWLKSSETLVPFNEQLLAIPAKSAARQFLPWVLPVLAVGIMVGGFFFADTAKALEGIGIWVVSHSALAGLAAILVLAHPISVLVAIVTSPFTSLNPTISVGLVTALTEVLLRKPRVKDVEDLLKLEKWWQFHQNRIWHALIIFMVVSLGGAAATFIALPWLSVLFSA